MGIILFLAFPRVDALFPSLGRNLKGKIGYSKNLDNSTTANLSQDDSVIFRATVDKELSNNQLYWKGRTLSFTDGYNWRSGIRESIRVEKQAMISGTLKQVIKTEQSMEGDLIALDSPNTIIPDGFRIRYNTNTNGFYSSKRDKMNYTAYSTVNSIKRDTDAFSEDFTRLPGLIPKRVKEIHQVIENSDPTVMIKNLENYLKINQYTYSLNPGRMPTINDFLSNKKGYCSHYASLLALLLRMSNIPTNVVSGFQGGEYNSLGSYYIIKANDAHAWVESYYNGKWNRLDPTAFVSPERVRLGGQNYHQDQLLSSSLFGKQLRFLINSNFIKEIELQIDVLNYRYSLFMDNFNRETQRIMAKYFDVNLTTFYISAALSLFLLGILFRLALRSKGATRHSLKQIFLRKLQKKLNLSPNAGMENLAYYQNIIQSRPEFQEVFDDFIELYYANEKQSREYEKKLISKLRSIK
jgi:hypothetical protein